jgi:hypothetical protein
MTIEARKPPPQFIFRLKRALGGRAGWTGFALQILFVAALVWIAMRSSPMRAPTCRRSGSHPVSGF